MTGDLRTRLLETALRAARSAGDAALAHFGSRDLEIETKGDGSPVTKADRQAERRMREVIAGAFPDDLVLGEEYASENGEKLDTGRRQWIIDPIDGTASFIRGVPLFGALVGIIEDGKPIVGVIHLPALNETVFAAKGRGAWFQSGSDEPVPAHVSGTSELARATVCTTSDDYFRQSGARPVWDAVRDACASTRGWSDCYAFALLATGRIDAAIEPPVLHPWDAAGAIPVIEEAGGIWTDWDGVCSVERRSVAASNGLIHAELLDRIRAASQRDT